MRHPRISAILSCTALLLCAGTAFAQRVGTVQGTVTDPTNALIPGATVTLSSAISGYEQTMQTDANGAYKFSSVPFAQFTLHAEAPGFDHHDATAELRSNIPLVINIQLHLPEAKQEITVTEQAPLLETTSAGTHHDLDLSKLERQPVLLSGRAIAAVVQSVPGVVQDDNGRMHARGSESAVQYVVDGVPVTEQLSAIFSTSLDARNLRSSEVITGNIPAEYGGKLGAVITVNTRSGLEMPWSGSVSMAGGSFGTTELGLEFGGHSRTFGVFASAGGSRTERYLDPPEIESFHNTGGNGRFFVKFDWVPTPNNTLRLTLSTNGTDFQVPNRLQQELLRQHLRQELRDDSQALGWQHVFSPTMVGDLVLYRRSSASRLLDPRVTGFPYYAMQSRRQRREGARFNLSKEFKHNSFKVGVELERIPLGEHFQLAVTDAAILADPLNPASAFPLSSPFDFNQHRTGKQVAVYVQDRITYAGFTVDIGLRYDHYNVVVHDDHLSPRVGLAYHVKRTGTVLRGSYNRLFQTPPIENLLFSSSPEGAVFSSLTGGVRAVPPEIQNAYEVGLQQQIGKYMRLDVAHYVKNIDNVSDKDQFLDTGVIFPIGVARGDVRGTELRLDLTPVRGFSAFLSFANAKAINSTPLVGGLFLGEADDDLLVPGVQFAADHDQRNTGQFGVTYSHRSGAWVTFMGRHDSGVPSEFDPALLPTLDARIRAELDPVRGRVKPRDIFSVAAGYQLRRETRNPINLQFAVQNLFNRFFLYNFESVFSGTHIGRPREVSVRVAFHFASETKPKPVGD